jgi:hypothetical protein
MGVRFQLEPDGPTNDLIIHVKMKDSNNHLQQEAIGILGVNMIYACFKFHHNMHEFVQSLIDGIGGRVEIDLLRLEGPQFSAFDNRLLSLYCVKYGLTEVSIFSHQKRCIHASEFLWKKDLMVVRGHYRPPTIVTLDVFEAGFKQFVSEADVREDSATIITEMTLDNLIVDGQIDESDFLDRADAICALGHNVIISDCSNHQTLINYLDDHQIGKLGLVIGVRELSQIIEEKYYNNQDGRLLVAFGELFNRNITVYVYPAFLPEGKKYVEAKNLMVPDGIHFLYKHLIDAHQIVEISSYNKSLLEIMPGDVLESIQKDDGRWEKAVPEVLRTIIKDKKLFNFATKSLNLA